MGEEKQLQNSSSEKKIIPESNKLLNNQSDVEASRTKKNPKCRKPNKKQCLIAFLFIVTVAPIVCCGFIKFGISQTTAAKITFLNATVSNNTVSNITASNITASNIDDLIKFKVCTRDINFANKSKEFEIDAKLTLNETNTYAHLILEVGGEWIRRERQLCPGSFCYIKISDKTGGNMTVRFTPAEKLISCEWTLNES